MNLCRVYCRCNMQFKLDKFTWPVDIIIFFTVFIICFTVINNGWDLICDVFLYCPLLQIIDKSLRVTFLVSKLLLPLSHVMPDHVLPHRGRLQVVDQLHPWPRDPQLIGDYLQGIGDAPICVVLITIVTMETSNHGCHQCRTIIVQWIQCTWIGQFSVCDAAMFMSYSKLNGVMSAQTYAIISY